MQNEETLQEAGNDGNAPQMPTNVEMDGQCLTVGLSPAPFPYFATYEKDGSLAALMVSAAAPTPDLVPLIAGWVSFFDSLPHSPE